MILYIVLINKRIDVTLTFTSPLSQYSSLSLVLLIQKDASEINP